MPGVPKNDRGHSANGAVRWSRLGHQRHLCSVRLQVPVDSGNALYSSWVRRLLWINQLGQLSLLPSVGRGMSIARWVKLLAVSPSSEYEGKADVVYLQVTLYDPHLSA